MATDFRISLPTKSTPLRLTSDDIKILLFKRRVTITMMAEAIGEKRTTTSMVLHGHSHSLAVRQKITQYITQLLIQHPQSGRKHKAQAA
ncbi:MAG TPA: hypothetical protein VE262_21935 [Blastocatellia bacterium]|nr:hypothetical protein [Blastocatellia bacterium]